MYIILCNEMTNRNHQTIEITKPVNGVNLLIPCYHLLYASENELPCFSVLDLQQTWHYSSLNIHVIFIFNLIYVCYINITSIYAIRGIKDSGLFGESCCVRYRCDNAMPIALIMFTINPAERHNPVSSHFIILLKLNNYDSRNSSKNNI